MLDLVKEKIGPQCALPRSLLVAADNTTRESKNQIFANFYPKMLIPDRAQPLDSSDSEVESSALVPHS